MKRSLTILSVTAALSFGWVALAQQTPGTPPTTPTTPTTPGTTTPGTTTPGTTTPGTTPPGTTTPGTSTTPGSNTAVPRDGNGLEIISCNRKSARTTTPGTANPTNAATNTTNTTGSTTTGTAGTTSPTTAPAGNTGTGTTGSTSTTTTPGTTPAPGTAPAGTTGTSGAAGAGRTLDDLSAAEVCFMDKAASSNQFEIESSQLALNKSSSDAVKRLAQTIIDDHQAAGNRLKALARGYGAVPSTQLNAQQQASLKALQGLDGQAFNITYVTQQIAAHNDAINLFKSYSTGANSPTAGVRQFASQTVPVLEKHLRSARDIQQGFGSK